MRLWHIITAAALVGCSLPPPPPPGSGDPPDGPDASVGSDDVEDEVPEVDAGPRPDARPPRVTELSHSTSMTVELNNSVACLDGDDNHQENSYYRVFDLAALGVSGGFRVTGVDVGVDSAQGGGDNVQQIQVRLHTLAGDLENNNLTQLAQTELSVVDSVITTIRADFDDVDVAAGSTLVVEVRTPDGSNGNNTFFIGSNNDGQSAPSYLRAPDCGDNDPRDLADIGFPDMHVVMAVLGSASS